jgi:YebC/PmpR family DNA-binding regulatory protein
MAGHSHWAGIKHKKAATDAKRGRLWSKLARGIMSAARTGGGDPKSNLSLQYAIDKAKGANMPKDTIERAILKGTGELEGEQLEQVQYEGYGPGGVAIMVDCLTDNRNRTTPLVRKAFENHGGNMGTSGCVSWIFERKGLFHVALGERTEDEVFELVVEAGAEDFQRAGEVYEVTCPVEEYGSVRDALTEAGVPTESSEVTMVPKNYVELGEKDGRKVLALMEDLDELDDVEAVHANFDLPEELITEMAGES